MNSFLKHLLPYIIKLLQTFTTLINITFFSKWRIKKAKVFEQSEDVSVLANGPSAKEVISSRKDLLEGKDLLAMNDMAISDAFKQLKPKHYILLDPAYFITGYGVASEANAGDFSVVVKHVVESLLSVEWPMILYLPASKKAEEFSKNFHSHKYVTVERFNANRIEGFDRFQFWAFRKSLGVPSSRNIIIPALLLMIQKGYKNIYLYGAEFSWTKTMDIDPENGKMFFNDRHFYSKDEIRYFEKGGYLWWLSAIAEMLKGINIVASYSEKEQVKIVNRTKGSFIDSFPYENIDKIEYVKKES